MEPSDTTTQQLTHRIDREERQLTEDRLIAEKRKQAGIGFPSAGDQQHLLIIRLNLARTMKDDVGSVQRGLQTLCGLFARLDRGDQKIDKLTDAGLQSLPLKEFTFSATIGFGRGFFDLLAIDPAKRPRNLAEMPDHAGLGDVTPYSLGQTDLIVQLGSTEDFVNRWALENALQPTDPGGAGVGDPPDIVTAVRGWATITDFHSGFQRVDGRNLQGFNDGVSNPRRLSPLFDQLVWTTATAESPALIDGTYMVFQKIVHDLDQWRELDVEEQQEWVGRSKGTGLLLGTLPDDEDTQLASALHAADDDVREAALTRWQALFDAQADPTTPFFDHNSDGTPKFGQIPDRCPAWAHVRKANPRVEDGRVPTILIFRRGYPFMESGLDHKTRSGLLFVCFQNNIENGFAFLKRNWFNNGGFPVPMLRAEFTTVEIAARHRGGRYSEAELQALTAEQRTLVGLAADSDFQKALVAARDPETQQTGREGLASPSELGVTPTGAFLAIVPLGGGYYFVPPIPNQDIAQIGQQFFD